MPTTDSPPANKHTAREPAARTQLVLTALLVALYAAARLWRLTATCLWFDEIFSVQAARHTWGGLWSFAAADLIHPPLFYALLKLWASSGGDSLLWLRLFPALTSLLALAPFFLLARELRLARAETNAALLLMAANGYLIKYAQELRMYSLLLLLALASLWLFARLLNSEPSSPKLSAAPKLFLALGFVNLLLVYTHYYGWLVVACEAAFLLFKDRRRLPRFLLAVAALALLFAPWVAACVRASGEGGGLSQNVGWIGRPRAADLAEAFALFNEPFYFQRSSDQPLYARGGAALGLLLVGLPVLALLLRSLRRAKEKDAPHKETTDGGALIERGTHEGARQGRVAHEGAHDEHVEHEGEWYRDAIIFLAFFTLLPVALAFAASLALPFSVWGTRHVIIAAGPYFMLAGVALIRLRPFWLKSAALVLLCCWFFFVGALLLATRGDGDYIWCAWENLARSALRDEAGETQTAAGGETAAARQPAGVASRRPVNLYAFEDLVAYHLWFALDSAHETGMRVSVLQGVPGVSEDPAYFLPRGFDGVARARADSLSDERFWAAFRDAEWDESRPPLSVLIARGYRAERVYEAAAQGQRAFLVLFTREPQTK
ncbi:MAG TPA: glycosyltransferase family 39 protein [Pyrinomonadaceae bacterium]|nr:glycosyltransferase family 39 protein [Pyrinomonadaceae bacterium]